MKTKACPYCNTEIEFVDRFVESDEAEIVSFKEPCSKCKNNKCSTDEMLCSFCIHLQGIWII
ncbi:MAG: hypothetical protein D4S01_10775 [Dehalococcoidia bacterium]|nr:MAG: hypothetical protein D4S01_10775 [Dehalococcoidia bacterium]